MTDGPLARGFRWFAAILVLVMLPLFLAFWGIGAARDRGTRLQLEEAQARLDRNLLTMLSRSDPERYLSRLLMAVIRLRMPELAWSEAILTGSRQLRDVLPSFFWEGLRPMLDPMADDLVSGLFRLLARLQDTPERQTALVRAFHALRARFPGALRIRAVDETGRLLRSCSDETGEAAAITSLFQALRKDQDQTLTRLACPWTRPPPVSKVSEVWPAVSRFLGPVAAERDILPNVRDLAPVSFQARDRYFSAYVGPLGGFFCHFTETDDWNRLALADIFHRFRKRFAAVGYRFGFLSRDPGKSDEIPGLGRKRLLELVGQGANHVVTATDLVALYPLDGRTWAWAARRRPDLAFPVGPAVLVLFLAGGGILAASLLFQVLVRHREIRVPLRWQLVSLFAYSSAVPLLLILTAGLVSLDMVRQETREQLRERLERAVECADQGLAYAARGLEERLNGILEREPYLGPETVDRLGRVLRRVSRAMPKGNFALTDRKGRLIWGRDLGGREGDSGERLVGALAAPVLAILNRESGTLLSMLIMHSLANFTSEKNILAEVAGNLGRVRPLALGLKPVWTYFQPVYDRQGRAQAMLVVLWKSYLFESWYMNRLSPLLRHLPGGLLLGTQAEKRNVLELGPEALGNRVRPLFEEIHRTQGEVGGLTRLQGRSYLYHARRPQFLQTSYFLGLCPADLEQEVLDSSRRRLFLFVTLLFASSCFLGLVFGRRFLEPIRDLTSGVQAISRRDFRVRLPAPETDEFGDLKRSFNGMLEGLRDLEVARIIQENLFPAGALSVGRFQVFGSTRMASQIGGDYCDYQTLADGRMLFLIGDVSGHGVPAALVVAMAKALIVMYRNLEEARGKRITPEGALEFLQERLFARLGLNKMMTCLLGVADPETDLIDLAAAAHNQPYVCRPPGSPQTLDLPPSNPLFRRRRPGFGRLAIRLQPGEFLVCYSDGIPEATGHDGEQLGMGPFLATLPVVLEADLPGSCRAILGWLDRQVRPGPQEDDITLLLIRRGSDQG